MLTYLPGRIVDVDDEELTDAQLVELVRWVRDLHDVTDGWTHDGPWRWFEVADAEVVGHNDVAPYNVAFDGDRRRGCLRLGHRRPVDPAVRARPDRLDRGAAVPSRARPPRWRAGWS